MICVSLGTATGGGETVIGDENYFMNYTHVGHDNRIGSRVVMANYAVLAGHGQRVILPAIPEATVGGVVAVGHSDIRRLGYGALRDAVTREGGAGAIAQLTKVIAVEGGERAEPAVHGLGETEELEGVVGERQGSRPRGGGALSPRG